MTKKFPIFLCVIIAVIAISVLAMEHIRQNKDLAEARSPHSYLSDPRQEDWWQKRHADLVVQIRNQKPDILFLGDSLVQNWQSEGREVWDQYYGNRNAATSGIGGETIQNTVWRVANGAINDVSPGNVIVMTGTNNVQPDTQSQILRSMDLLLSILHYEIPDAQIILMGILPMGDNPVSAERAKIKMINATFEELADEKDIPFVDIGLHLLNADGTMSHAFADDHVHLSKEGYRIWAEQLEPLLVH